MVVSPIRMPSAAAIVAKHDTVRQFVSMHTYCH